MSNENDNPRIKILLAVIAALSTLGTASLTNLDKINKIVQIEPKGNKISELKQPNIGVTSKAGVAIVFAPPSNVREFPNGKILCSVRERGKINIYNLEGNWYETDICGSKGFIHSSQITFKSK